jgi:hypothetical protein
MVSLRCSPASNSEHRGHDGCDFNAKYDGVYADQDLS